MPKDSKINKGNPKSKGPGGRPKGKKNNPKTKKKAIVYLPAIIPGKHGINDPDELCEHEIDYEDKLLCVQIERLAAKGFTNNEIIAAIGISRNTFYQRLRTEEYFSYCLFKHRGIPELEIESSLRKSALGFSYVEQVATPSGEVLTVQRFALPNVNAQKFYLTNKRAAEWKNKPEEALEQGKGLEAITFSLKRREE